MLCVVALLLPVQTALAFPAKFGLSPDNSRELLLSTLSSAKKTLTINMYDFDSEDIVNVLASGMKAGVTVKILFECSPAFGMSDGYRNTVNRLRAMMTASGGAHRIFLMCKKPEQRSKRRFRWNHAKYTIIDGKAAYVSSENFKTHGFPEKGETGNRGWQVFLESGTAAGDLQKLFEEDTDSSNGDIIELRPGQSLKPRQAQQPRNKKPCDTSGYISPPSMPVGEGDVRRAKLVTAPHALAPVTEIIRSASKQIDLEQMYIHKEWKDEDGNHITSPMITELVRAARRGVSVRVLVNNDNVWGNAGTGQKNADTVKLLMDYKRCYKLPIAAKMINAKKAGITYIHNKGILVDTARVLVSSINFSQNSIERNREAAMLLESEDARRYFGEAFDHDWKSTADRQPLSRDKTTCPKLPD